MSLDHFPVMQKPHASDVCTENASDLFVHEALSRQESSLRPRTSNENVSAFPDWHRVCEGLTHSLLPGIRIEDLAEFSEWLHLQ